MSQDPRDRDFALSALSQRAAQVRVASKQQAPFIKKHSLSNVFLSRHVMQSYYCRLLSSMHSMHLPACITWHASGADTCSAGASQKQH